MLRMRLSISQQVYRLMIVAHACIQVDYMISIGFDGVTTSQFTFTFAPCCNTSQSVLSRWEAMEA